jgi:hypothetical protein
LVGSRGKNGGNRTSNEKKYQKSDYNTEFGLFFRGARHEGPAQILFENLFPINADTPKLKGQIPKKRGCGARGFPLRASLSVTSDWARVSGNQPREQSKNSALRAPTLDRKPAVGFSQPTTPAALLKIPNKFNYLKSTL